MNDITKPLTLWRGSYEAGSGKGCAMNVISWENGDKTITDYPECSDRVLARIVQVANDSLAQPDGSLTPEDSMRVLDLGHSTVGTAYHSLSGLDLRRVYVRLAVHAARKVLHLAKSPHALAAVEAAEAWAADPTSDNRAAAAACAYTFAASAADEAAYAAAAVAIAATDAIVATEAAAYATNDRYFRAELAAELIDLFKSLVPLAEPGPLPVSPDEAIRRLQEVY